MRRALGIVLTTGQIALIDEVDAWLAGMSWRLYRGYVRRSDGRHLARLADRALHRAVLSATPGQLVDHINGDPLDNRRCNLRIASPTENVRNVGQGQVNSPAGVIGVGWHAGRQKWQASIRVAGKLIYLGLFTEIEAAKAARVSAELKFWGTNPRRLPHLN